MSRDNHDADGKTVILSASSLRRDATTSRSTLYESQYTTVTEVSRSRDRAGRPRMSEDLRKEPNTGDSTGWNVRRKPAGIGIGIGRSVFAGSKAIQGKRPRSLYPLFFFPPHGVEAPTTTTTAIIHIYYPFSLRSFSLSIRLSHSTVALSCSYITIRDVLNPCLFKSA